MFVAVEVLPGMYGGTAVVAEHHVELVDREPEILIGFCARSG